MNSIDVINCEGNEVLPKIYNIYHERRSFYSDRDPSLSGTYKGFMIMIVNGFLKN